MHRSLSALAVGIALLATAGFGGQPEARPASREQRAQLGEIVDDLDSGHWKPARKAAWRLADEVARTMWERRETASLLGELCLYRAVAENNLGLERQALWHWQEALTLWPPVAERPLERWDRGAELTGHPLRATGEMPAGLSGPDDIESLRIEAAALRYDDPPSLENPTAARRGPHPDVSIELVVERSGVLGWPRVLTDEAPPVAIYGLLEWLLALPPARPARLDGEPVDSLLTLTIDLENAWSRGGLLMKGNPA